MKKGPSPSAQKAPEQKIPRKAQPEIKFNLSSDNLACFQVKDKTPLAKHRIQATKELKNACSQKNERKNTSACKKQQCCSRQRGRTLQSKSNFNEKVFIMQYDNIEVYVDKSKAKKPNETNSKELSEKKKSESGSDPDEDIVQSCVKVITQETDNTSNSMYTPNSLTPRSFELAEHYQTSEYRSFTIEFDRIEQDGRTTVMVKNIPNKYTQETLLEEFSKNYDTKFDFFYLPIDKNNNCNVGYAFVNFTHVSHLKSFYEQFHERGWKKYKSPKICHICYARYQGTLELANHFRHSKILQNKDRKVKPLIGMIETNRINLEEMVKNQRGARE